MSNDAMMARPAQRRTLSWRKRAVFVVILYFLLALFTELSLQIFYRASVGRWLWEWWAIPIYAEDPVRVYRLKSNLDFVHQTREYTARYCTDQFGMRVECGQPGPAIQKSNDTFRILALGPSFTFGWGDNYEDSYMLQIAKGLHVPGKRVELINLGTPAQPVSFQLKWLKAVGARYQPDLIVQTVYANIDQLDTDDTLPSDTPLVKGGYLYPSHNTTFAGRFKQLRLYSATLFYGWQCYYAVRTSAAPAGDGREFYTRTISETTSVDQDVKRFQRYTEFVHGALTNQTPIAFLYVPQAHVVRPADVTRVKHHSGTVNPMEMRRKDAATASALRSNGVQIIDPTDALVKNDRLERMYFLYDIHFTPAGNKVVADYALPMIQKLVQQTTIDNH